MGLMTVSMILWVILVVVFLAEVAKIVVVKEVIVAVVV